MTDASPVDRGPARTGTALSVLAVVGVAALLLATGGGGRGVALGVAGAVALGATVHLSWTDRAVTLARALSVVAAAAAGGLLVGSLASTLAAGATPGRVLSLGGLAAAAFGVTTTPADGYPTEPLGSASLAAAVTLALAVGSAALSLSGVAAAFGTGVSLLGGVFLAPPPMSVGARGWVFVSFVVVASLAAFGGWLAARSVPVSALVAADRRPTVEDRLDRTKRWLRTLSFAGLLSTPLLWALKRTGTLDALLSALPRPLAVAALAVVNAHVVRLALAFVLAGGAAVAVAAWGLRRLARLDRATVDEWGAPLAGTAAVALGAGVGADPALSTLAARLPPTVGAALVDAAAQFGATTLVFLGVGVALGVVLGSMAGLALLRVAGFLRGPGAGVALAATGLFVATVGAGVAGASPVVVFVGVAGALLAWDVGSHAAGLGVEVGRAAPTRHAELVHGAGSTLVAGAGVVVAVGGLAALRRVGSPDAVPALAVLGAVLGLLALFATLRG